MRTIILLILTISIFSCSITTKNDIGIVEETKNTINDYGDTLEGSIKDAKNVRDLYNQKGDDLNTNIETSTR
nr:hypothetical protein [Candidatus Gracilibacteria bacterium]